MKSKKGMELSINFIVVLILSIVVFSFGLIFIRNVFQQANEIKAQLDESSQNQVESLLDRGEMVAIPVASKDVKAGGAAVFGIGILNVQDTANTFRINVTCSVATSVSGQAFPDQDKACSGNWFAISTNDFTLQPNDKKVVPVAVQPPGDKSKGTYGFNVIVSTITPTPKQYGPVRQFYINIV